MKKSNFLIATFLLAMSFGAKAQDPQDEYKVLFIGIDGVRTDALKQQMAAGNAPNLKSLFDNGLFTFDSWHLGVTSSGPSWSDMLTGVWEAKHGVTNNNYTGSNYNQYPYFVTRAKECRANLKAVQVTSWSPMSNNVYNDGWNNKIIPPTDDACASVAVSQLVDAQLDVLFVHLDDVDGAGHGNGFNPSISSYMNAVKYADTKVGEVLAALYNRPNYANEKWMILATTDHGGTGFTHGGNSNDERHIWWVASGPGIPQTEIIGVDPGSYQFGTAPTQGNIAQTPVLTDIAVTALDHLLTGTTCLNDNIATWKLDGKSWITSTAYVENVYAEDHLKVFPNPNNGVFDLVIDAEFEGVKSIQIVDVTGKIVYESAIELTNTYMKSKIDITSLNAGNYILKVITDKNVITKKIIKN